ncbi:MAG: hypothetical protein B7Y30_08705 [Campylobacterales bacterium 16-40-21]|nr:MAG: hypothetical protein B7Y30_08705 [Campylobacterales bacterium 16-40-21]
MRSTVRVTYTIPKNIIEKLESISKRHGIFKSNIIAESINTDSRFTDLMCTSLLYDESKNFYHPDRDEYTDWSICQIIIDEKISYCRGVFVGVYGEGGEWGH